MRDIKKKKSGFTLIESPVSGMAGGTDRGACAGCTDGMRAF